MNMVKTRDFYGAIHSCGNELEMINLRKNVERGVMNEAGMIFEGAGSPKNSMSAGDENE